MIKVENYPNAYKEVYVILNNMHGENLKAIPQSFIDAVQKNMNNDYDFKLDENLDFDKQNILKETKVILAYIFLNYWATEEQKSRIMNKFRQDIINEERSKPKYNPDELFKKNQSQNISSNIVKKEENQLIEYKKENIFVKFINAIKRLFKRK